MNFLSAGFHIGDCVECVGLQSGNHMLIGECGKIIWMSTSGENVSVEFNHPFPGGHQGTKGDGRPGCCWNFRWDDTLEKLRRIGGILPPPDLGDLF